MFRRRDAPAPRRLWAAPPTVSAMANASDRDQEAAVAARRTTDGPLVSVVLPTRDRASVLDRAIESVLAQSYDHLELIVVDGGSTDRTPALVDAVDDDRLSYLRRERSEGVSAARNAGVREADGELIAFVDSDDRWRPEKLRLQVGAYERAGEQCGAAYGGIVKDRGEPLTRGGLSGDVAAEMRRLDLPTYTSTLLFSREALDRCGGFDERLPCFEDWELCLRVAAEYEFVYVDETLAVKGTGGDNISADPDRLVEAIRRLRTRYDLPAETEAQLFADAGVTYCEAGRLAEGRPYLRRALTRDVRSNAVAALAFSLPGSPAAFDALMAGLYAAERGLDRLRS